MRDLVENCGLSYAEVSKECHRQRPGLNGFSAKSVRRFCKKNMIFRLTRISDGDLIESQRCKVNSPTYSCISTVLVWMILLIFIIKK